FLHINMAVFQQHVMDIDIYRTNLCTVAAEAGGKAEMAEIRHAFQMRRDHGTNRPAIGSGISMTANIFIYGAGIQTGDASDEIHRFAYGLFQQIGSSVS